MTKTSTKVNRKPEIFAVAILNASQIIDYIQADRLLEGLCYTPNFDNKKPRNGIALH